MKTCNIKYFGMIAEKLEKESEEINISDLKAISNEVNKAILKLHPALEGMSFTVAVNEKIAERWNEQEEIYSIAVLPPFAGG